MVQGRFMKYFLQFIFSTPALFLFLGGLSPSITNTNCVIAHQVKVFNRKSLTEAGKIEFRSSSSSLLLSFSL